MSDDLRERVAEAIRDVIAAELPKPWPSAARFAAFSAADAAIAIVAEACADIAYQHASCEWIAQVIAAKIRALAAKEGRDKERHG